MSEINTNEPRDMGNGVGQFGSSSGCESEGNAVFKWVNGQFVLDANNCKSGHVPPAPPTPNANQQSEIETFNEFRAVVCCEAGSSS